MRILNHFLLILTIGIQGCYDPSQDRPKPEKEYLASHVIVIEGGTQWETDEAKCAYFFDGEEVYFSALDQEHLKRFSYSLKGFGNFKNQNPDSVIQIGEYWNGAYGFLTFNYTESKNGKDVNDPLASRASWTGGHDSTLSVFTIREVFSYDEEIYLSGSFTGFAFKDGNDPNQIGSVYLSGSFDTVRVNSINF